MKMPKFRVKPFRQTKEEKQEAKLLGEYLSFMWEDFDTPYSRFVRDCIMLNDKPEAHMFNVYWDKKGQLKKKNA